MRTRAVACAAVLLLAACGGDGTPSRSRIVAGIAEFNTTTSTTTKPAVTVGKPATTAPAQAVLADLAAPIVTAGAEAASTAPASTAPATTVSRPAATARTAAATTTATTAAAVTVAAASSPETVAAATVTTRPATTVTTTRPATTIATTTTVAVTTSTVPATTTTEPPTTTAPPPPTTTTTAPATTTTVDTRVTLGARCTGEGPTAVAVATTGERAWCMGARWLAPMGVIGGGTQPCSAPYTEVSGRAGTPIWCVAEPATTTHFVFLEIPVVPIPTTVP